MTLMLFKISSVTKFSKNSLSSVQRFINNDNLYHTSQSEFKALIHEKLVNYREEQVVDTIILPTLHSEPWKIVDVPISLLPLLSGKIINNLKYYIPTRNFNYLGRASLETKMFLGEELRFSNIIFHEYNEAEYHNLNKTNVDLIILMHLFPDKSKQQLLELYENTKICHSTIPAIGKILSLYFSRLTLKRNIVLFGEDFKYFCDAWNCDMIKYTTNTCKNYLADPIEIEDTKTFFPYHFQSVNTSPHSVYSADVKNNVTNLDNLTTFIADIVKTNNFNSVYRVSVNPTIPIYIGNDNFEALTNSRFENLQAPKICVKNLFSYIYTPNS